MLRGKGNDCYAVDSQDDLIVEKANEGIDTVTSSVTFDLGTNGANVEILDLKGTNNGDAFGNDLNNGLFGDETDNTLDGRAGKDTMVGGAGDDRSIVDNV